MVDRVNRETRSRIMSSIRGRDTRMELAAKPALEALGFEHQAGGVFGNPDFAHREAMVAVFLDGCFWHGCPDHCKMPKSNVKFWRDKIDANAARDMAVDRLLKGSGWRVIRVWEHDLSALVKAAKNKSKRENGEA